MSGTLARIGGDEFAIIVDTNDEHLQKPLADLADSVVMALNSTFNIDSEMIEIGCSIGLRFIQIMPQMN